VISSFKIPPHVKTLIESLEVEENLDPYKKQANRKIQTKITNARVRDLGIKNLILYLFGKKVLILRLNCFIA
jgi:hypothetical protein